MRWRIKKIVSLKKIAKGEYHLQKIKVLSVKQPWAWCIFNAGKNVENRTWATNYRGELYIHASQQFDWLGLKQLNDEYEVPRDMILFEQGAIIGKVDIVSCVVNHPSNWADKKCWNFVLENPKPIKPIYCKGRLNIFEVDLYGLNVLC